MAALRRAQGRTVRRPIVFFIVFFKKGDVQENPGAVHATDCSVGRKLPSVHLNVVAGN